MLILPGAAGDFAETPDHASLDITGTLTLIADVALDDWSPAAEVTLVAKYSTAAQRAYLFDVQPNGDVIVRISPNGTTPPPFIGPNVAGFAAGARQAVRADIVPDNGSNQQQVTFFLAPTAAGPWVQQGAPVVQAGAISIFNSSSPLMVGSLNAGASSNLAGKVYAAQVIDGTFDSGAVVANPQFAGLISGGAGAFVDSTRKTWTVHGNAKLRSPIGNPPSDRRRRISIGGQS